jgi:hypothetical protein
MDDNDEGDNEKDWLEVPIPYIFGLFCRLNFHEISPQNMALYVTVPPFQDPEIPIDKMEVLWGT